MPKPKLPRDADAHPIQAVELSDDAVAIAVGLSSTRDAFPSGARLVRIGLDTDAYIRFGDNTVTVTASNGHYFPAGVEVLAVPRGATDLANISADGSSTGQGTMCSIGHSFDE